MTKAGAAGSNLIFAADNTYTGDTTINAGSLQLGNGGVTGDVAGNIVFGAETTSLTLNHGANDYTLDSQLTGAGSLTQLAANTGTTSITSDNDGSYTGAISIQAGTLQAGNGGTTGTFGTGDISVASGATVGINRSDNYEVQNVINGADGGILRKQGDGTATFAKAVTVSKTLIDDGTLVAGTNYNGGDVTVG
ncbi:autotransporter-associated beta strand repeat-containing protein, partial [Gallibacterium sp. AGMB14963]|uniref:autotransporter-associated beta strand repeat-containing protein n=1 Tax=Gallibacterium faecale TaxID=3019086 RepID=UPI0022F14CE9